MDGVVPAPGPAPAWWALLWLSLQVPGLCNCHPAAPLDRGSSQDIEVGSMLPSLLVVSASLVVLLFLVGCTWCTKIFKKDTRCSQQIQLGETVSSEATDPGIPNPLTDIRFPINNPISHNSSSPASPDGIELPLHIPYFPREHQDVDNNNLFEDNNNGPISPQELENIVNNNAENYIVSEYENRELQIEVLDDVQVAPMPPLSHASPSHNVWAEYRDWFYDVSEDFPRTQLQYLQVIGKGWFGRIVEGEAHNDEDNITRVAVKILDENVSVTDKCTFLQQSQMLKDSKHDTILKYIGKNLAQDPWFILLEHCPVGDLKQYLLSNNFQMQSIDEQGIPLKFILDISSALNYLHQKNVYYDVACHSCLVTLGPSVRLGDYGDAVQRYPQHFCSVSGSKPLPIRWLPPEYFIVPLSSPGGSVWSFGVFMWECCSWGSLPYESLSDDQVIWDVLPINGVRLQPPVPNTQCTQYLYTVMQSCWNNDPLMRCHISQVHEYLQNLYANFYKKNSHADEPTAHNFNIRWEMFKPNTIPKVDNSLPSSPPHTEDNHYNINFSQGDITLEPDIKVIHVNGELAYQNPAISTDTFSIDEITLKVKSDSLNNLHGSFESVSAHDIGGIGTSGEVATVPQVAPWLMNVPFNTPEDISYIKNVSDVISDFDNMLSSEKTSSSESSPSRDVPRTQTQTSGIACDHGSSQLIISEDSVKTVSLNDSSAMEINSYLKECQSQESAYDTNVGSESVNNSLNNVPEINKFNIKDIYPTLDFRLSDAGEQVHPMFEACNTLSTQELDSLQDSSYTPTVNREKDITPFKQSSSGSETEDEVWKERVEKGLITEKIKMKSKSVTDFMVLTHIDMDFTDMESEDASYNSLEGKSTAFYDLIHRRLKRKLSQPETSLPTQQFSSFPRNFSSSVINEFVSLGPQLDLYKLWKNCKLISLKNLRPSKSLSELNKSSTKPASLGDLQSFKVKMDSFLGPLSNKDHQVSIDPHSSQHNCIDSRYFDSPQANTTNYAVDNFLTTTEEEEDFKFSSNFNDINLNIYESGGSHNKSDLWDSTKYINLPDEFSLENQQEGQGSIKLQMYESEIDPDLSHSSLEWGLLTENVDSSTPDFGVDRDRPGNLVIPHVSVTEARDGSGLPSVANINSMVERQIDEIIRNEMINITTKLAIAENENNLNIELSSPPNPAEDEFGELDRGGDHDDVREVLNVNVHNSNVIPINAISTHDHWLNDQPNIITPSTSRMSAAHTDESLDRNPHFSDDLTVEISADTDNVEKVEAINEIVCVENKPPTHGETSQNQDCEKDTINLEDNYRSPETSESLYENVDPNHRKEISGWYLHPKEEVSDNVDDIVAPMNAFPINLPSSNCSSYSNSVESLTESTNSDHYAVDPESVEALRNELQLKLPLAQRLTQQHHDNVGGTTVADNMEWANVESPLPMCKPSMRDNNTPKLNSVDACAGPGTSRDIAAPIQSQSKNEIMIHYSIYGTVPLSPIQEESWSEFSEMEKAADIDKTDASNSLSLGEQTSNIEQVLPFDGVCDMKIMDPNSKQEQCNEATLDDDTYSDCSNRTFVMNEVGPTNLKRQDSLSEDSLNSIEQFDIDDEQDKVKASKVDLESNVETSTKLLTAHLANELFSPFYDDHSHPKSTEEISQNVDNLLENISKTLESASKISALGTERLDQLDVQEVDSDTSGSKTYVIERKHETVEDLKAVYNDKVAEIPDDVSNVSKVSQPSFVSDVTSPDNSDMKVSEKSQSHTKTLSMNSWCSNDTLFNVEENFDDAYIGELLLSPAHKMDFPFKSSTPQTTGIFEQPQVEMVVGCSDNLINCSLHEDNHLLSAFQQVDKSPPEKLELSKQFSILLPEPLVESCEETPKLNESKNLEKNGSLSAQDGFKDLELDSSVPSVLNADAGNECDVDIEVTPIPLVHICDQSSNNASGGQSFNSIANLNKPIGNVDDSFQSCNINMTSTPTFSMEGQIGINNFTSNVIDDNFKFLDNFSGEISDSKEKSSLLLQATNNFLQNEQCFAVTSLYNCLGSSASCCDSVEGKDVSRALLSDKSMDIVCSNVAQCANNTIDDCTKKGVLQNCPEEFFNEEINQLAANNIQSREVCPLKETQNSQFNADFVTDLLLSIYSEANISKVNQSETVSSTAEPAVSDTEIVAINLANTNAAVSSSNDLGVVVPYGLTNNSNPKDEGAPHEISGEHLDLNDPSVIEYMESTGLNMGLLNAEYDDSPTFETFKQSAGNLPQDLTNNADNEYSFNTLQELYSPGLRNIHFSGPWNEDVLSISLNETSPLSDVGLESTSKVPQEHEDIGHMAPERLKDWDTESDDSNCSSTSSTDFVWKEGGGQQLLNVPSISFTSSHGLRHQSSRGASQSFTDIVEETEDGKGEQDGVKMDDDEDEEDEEDMEFVPSSWDCRAAPSKSALKGPDTSQVEPRKRVAFKKQKYQSIYEYPRDDEAFHMLPEFSTYAEWNSTSSNDYMPVEFQRYLSPHMAKTDDAPSGSEFEDDFYMSSPTGAFEPYSVLNSSQFFPGQRFSLLNNQHDYAGSNDDEFESLPPIPTEQELRLALGDDINIVTSITEVSENKKSSDYVTPDSGTEDTSPGDLGDFEAMLNKKNLCTTPDPLCAVDEGVDNDMETTESVKAPATDETSIIPPSPGSETGASGVLGGLRHTRDKLKLDLPPSPLSRNSPKETRIFDFKNISNLERVETDAAASAPHQSEGSKVASIVDDKEKCLSSLESDTCDSDAVSPNSVVSVIRKFPSNIVEGTVKSNPPESNNCPIEADVATLHKSVIRMQDKARRVSLELVKGEGTLLDSGDEDSGIGSSAYATLERKCEEILNRPQLVKSSLNKHE